MSVFLRGFSVQLAPDVYEMLALDVAGWHVAAALQVPDDISLVKLPPYAPQLNPVERVWLYLRERFLLHRLHADQEAAMNAACKAWNGLTPNRLRSLCNYIQRSTGPFKDPTVSSCWLKALKTLGASGTPNCRIAQAWAVQVGFGPPRASTE